MRIADTRTVLDYGATDIIFMQGAPADSVSFVPRGKVRLTVSTHDGKEAWRIVVQFRVQSGTGNMERHR